MRPSKVRSDVSEWDMMDGFRGAVVRVESPKASWGVTELGGR